MEASDITFHLFTTVSWNPNRTNQFHPGHYHLKGLIRQWRVTTVPHPLTLTEDEWLITTLSATSVDFEVCDPKPHRSLFWSIVIIIIKSSLSLQGAYKKVVVPQLKNIKYHRDCMVLPVPEKTLWALTQWPSNVMFHNTENIYLDKTGN